MNRKYLTRPAAIAVIALLVAGSLAYAAWSVNGSGTGAASATSAVSLALTPGSPSDALFPGASADVATTITNSNPFPVHVTAITLDAGQASSGFAVDGGHGGCNINTLSFSAQTNGGSAGTSPPTTRSTSTRPTRSRWAPAPTTPVRARRSPCI